MILQRMPEETFAAIARSLVPVDLPSGMRLSEPNLPVRYVYFPVSGLISVDALTKKGESVEVGVVGREGLAGFAGLLGEIQMEHSVIMQGAGTGLRVRAQIVRDEFLKGGVFAELIHQFLYLQMVQTAQSVQPAASGGRKDGALDADGERPAGVAAAEPDAGILGADAGIATLDGDRGSRKPAAATADRLLARTD
jgi:CRP-like cAMP-binding protein